MASILASTIVGVPFLVLIRSASVLLPPSTCTMSRDEECSPEHVANKSHNIVTLELLQVGTISLELPYGFIWFWC